MAAYDLADALIAGGNAAFTAKTCSNATIKNAKTCLECAYSLSPTAYPDSTVQAIQQGLDQFVAECNRRGFSVQSVALFSKTGAALVRYEGSVQIAGAVGVAAVAGLLAL